LRKRKEREFSFSRPMGSAVEGFTRRTPPVEGYRTEQRLRRTRRSVGRSGGRVLLSFAKTFSAEQKDLGVFYQPVGDGGGDGGVVKNSAPLGEGGI
jgi:hypothetical protein